MGSLGLSAHLMALSLQLPEGRWGGLVCAPSAATFRSRTLSVAGIRRRVLLGTLLLFRIAYRRSCAVFCRRHVGGTADGRTGFVRIRGFARHTPRGFQPASARTGVGFSSSWPSYRWACDTVFSQERRGTAWSSPCWATWSGTRWWRSLVAYVNAALLSVLSSACVSGSTTRFVRACGSSPARFIPTGITCRYPPYSPAVAARAVHPRDRHGVVRVLLMQAHAPSATSASAGACC